MAEGRRLMPATIRGRILVVVMAALVTTIVMGGVLERWAKRGFATHDIEASGARVAALADLLRPADAAERQRLLDSARRAGWDVVLAPADTARRLTTCSASQSLAGAIADWLFPPDDAPPLGGWRTFLDDRRVIAVAVDGESIVILSGIPDTLLTSGLFGRGIHYFVAVIVLVSFVLLFAIVAITRPLQRLAAAAARADLASDGPVFAETGPDEIVTLARALNTMRGRIRRLMETRTRMLRGIGHDLRTPLTRLRLRVERMAGEGEGDRMAPLLADIDGLDGLIGQSLSFFRDAGAVEPVERVDIASLVRTICDAFADVGFAVGYHGPDRLLVDCRPLALQRAVNNLCGNSVAFAATVDVHLAADGDGWSLTVSDDGPGIPEALLERVIEPFFKVDPSRSPARGGFGLGLSIVAEIVEAHHGRLALRNRVPHGLDARIRIPGACPPAASPASSNRSVEDMTA